MSQANAGAKAKKPAPQQGAALLALAFGALSFLHKDVASHVELWLDPLRLLLAEAAKT